MNRKILLLMLAVLLVTGVGCAEVVASGESASARVVSEPEIELEAEPAELTPMAFMPAVAKVAPRVPREIPAAIQSITVLTNTPSAPGGPTATPTETPTPTLTAVPEKKVVVYRSQQRLEAFEGEELVFSARVSTGIAKHPTPLGEYRIYVKILKFKMEGGSKDEGTYYYLKDVPYIQYFWKGYGLHGTYWHENFGTPMSHGCVNLSLSDAEWLFNWTDPVLPEGGSSIEATEDNPGTLVVIQE